MKGRVKKGSGQQEDEGEGLLNKPLLSIDKEKDNRLSLSGGGGMIDFFFCRGEAGGTTSFQFYMTLNWPCHCSGGDRKVCGSVLHTLANTLACNGLENFVAMKIRVVEGCCVTFVLFFSTRVYAKWDDCCGLVWVKCSQYCRSYCQ